MITINKVWQNFLTGDVLDLWFMSSQMVVWMTTQTKHSLEHDYFRFITPVRRNHTYRIWCLWSPNAADFVQSLKMTESFFNLFQYVKMIEFFF